jgi:Transposase IS200 like
MTTTSSYESLAHSKWDCKYHIVFIPKGRKKVLYGKIRKFLGSKFHELANPSDHIWQPLGLLTDLQAPRFAGTS